MSKDKWWYFRLCKGYWRNYKLTYKGEKSRNKDDKNNNSETNESVN